MSTCAISVLFAVGRPDSKLWKEDEYFPGWRNHWMARARELSTDSGAPLSHQSLRTPGYNKGPGSLWGGGGPHVRMGNQMASDFSSAKLNSTS